MTDSIQTVQDIGKSIRQLRKKGGLTGGALGKMVGLSQSKISKIERGIGPFKKQEVEKILNILDCSPLITQRIMAVLNLTHRSFPSRYRCISNPPYLVYRREAETKSLRSFVPSLIPTLLQTPAYREALLDRWRLAPSELTQKMNEGLKRQDLLLEKGHSFHFIVQEAALYTLTGVAHIQLAQLDRLARMITLPRIKFGIIPIEAGMPPIDSYSFIIYDDRSTIFVGAQSEFHSTDPQDIGEHLHLFSELDAKACYGSGAQELIAKATHYFNFGLR